MVKWVCTIFKKNKVGVYCVVLDVRFLYVDNYMYNIVVSRNTRKKPLIMVICNDDGNHNNTYKNVVHEGVLDNIIHKYFKFIQHYNIRTTNFYSS